MRRMLASIWHGATRGTLRSSQSAHLWAFALLLCDGHGRDGGVFVDRQGFRQIACGTLTSLVLRFFRCDLDFRVGRKVTETVGQIPFSLPACGLVDRALRLGHSPIAWRASEARRYAPSDALKQSGLLRLRSAAWWRGELRRGSTPPRRCIGGRGTVSRQRYPALRAMLPPPRDISRVRSAFSQGWRLCWRCMVCLSPKAIRLAATASRENRSASAKRSL